MAIPQRFPPNCACVAGPPSPENPGVLPPKIEIWPLEEIFRMRPMASVVKIFPLESSNTPNGNHTVAWSAGPPSPETAHNPLPANSEITPDVLILRMRQLLLSPTYTLPDASTASPWGEENCAPDAGPPSPESPAVEVPANVVMIPAGLIARMRLLPVSAT